MIQKADGWNTRDTKSGSWDDELKKTFAHLKELCEQHKAMVSDAKEYAKKLKEQQEADVKSKFEALFID